VPQKWIIPGNLSQEGFSDLPAFFDSTDYSSSFIKSVNFKAESIGFPSLSTVLKPFHWSNVNQKSQISYIKPVKYILANYFRFPEDYFTVNARRMLPEARLSKVTEIFPKKRFSFQRLYSQTSMSKTRFLNIL